MYRKRKRSDVDLEAIKEEIRIKVTQDIVAFLLKKEWKLT
jgi:hypothetical protein